jgi:hypothetical protein
MTIDKVIQVDHQHLNLHQIKSTSKTTTSSGGGGQNSNYNQYTAYTPAQVKSGKAKVTADITKIMQQHLIIINIQKNLLLQSLE